MNKPTDKRGRWQLVGVALVFLFLLRPYADWLALILFIGASVTDWFDGYLARKWNQQSRFGAMLDPIADKAMVVIALVVVTNLFGMTIWTLSGVASSVVNRLTAFTVPPWPATST